MRTLTVALLVAAVASAPLGDVAGSKVVPAVAQALASGGRSDIFVRVAGPKAGAVEAGTGLSRAERRQAVFEARKEIAERTQGRVLEVVAEHGATARALWIVNAVYVSRASAAVVEALSALPEVEVIEANEVLARVEEPEAEAFTRAEVPWHMELINAPAAWNLTTGEGVVVAGVDTGVRYTHETLWRNYRGLEADGSFDHNYNWDSNPEIREDDFWCIPDWDEYCDVYPDDEVCCMQVPFDLWSHGTHTLASAVGSDGIGVAPGATWIAAKGCRDGACTTKGLLFSSEWVMCPLDLDYSNARCDLGADVVINSWGGMGGDRFLMDVIEAWVDAGMVPVYAAGNSGPRCGTISSPGDFAAVLGVGASDIDDSLASFSSRGPATASDGFSSQKPDLVAPGVNIVSAASSADDAMVAYSGTSMATPLVAGTAALMLSANPNLSPEDVMEILRGSAVPNGQMGPPDNGRTGTDECGDVRYDEPISFHYGRGRLDALNAVELSIRRSK